MREVICDTSPLQYLHQLRHLSLLHHLAASVVVPSAVVAELRAGLAIGIDLPVVEALEWLTVLAPSAALEPAVASLGPGESQVLALALERPRSVAVIDDAVARRTARRRGIPLTGTLGVLLDAKRAGLIPRVVPLLDELQSLGFRLAQHTRVAVIERAGEQGPAP